MVVLGYEDTTRVTMEDMIHHTKAVVRGTKRALVVTDMRFYLIIQANMIALKCRKACK
jgi:ketopantoate hydroxymethyltransferase